MPRKGPLAFYLFELRNPPVPDLTYGRTSMYWLPNIDFCREKN
jgi:hypothetical protein